MSGIYIPSMEMPDRCFSCPMCDTDCCGISRGSYIEYREIDVDVAMDGRPDWCPLIPVPPHGRLIDADAVEEVTWRANLSTREKVVAMIHLSPTVIPADKEGGR